MAMYESYVLNPRAKRGSKKATKKKATKKKATKKKATKKKATKKKATKKKATKKKAPPRVGKKATSRSAVGHGLGVGSSISSQAARRKKATGRQSPVVPARARPKAAKATHGVGIGATIAARSKVMEAKAREEAKKLETKLSALSKSKSKSSARVESLEKEIRSLRARVGLQRRRGDLTAAGEKKLKERLSKCQARLTKCRVQCEVPATRGKKKATKKKAAKRKVSKKATKKKATKRKVSKKATKKKATRRKSTGRTEVGMVRVSSTIASSRKAAVTKTKACAPKRKKNPATPHLGPVKCRVRPTASSLAACRRAYESWHKSDKRDPKKKKSVKTVCGPGAPRKKAAGYLGGKQKGKTAGKPRMVTPAEQKKIMAQFMRLGGK